MMESLPKKYTSDINNESVILLTTNIAHVCAKSDLYCEPMLYFIIPKSKFIILILYINNIYNIYIYIYIYMRKSFSTLLYDGI